MALSRTYSSIYLERLIIIGRLAGTANGHLPNTSIESTTLQCPAVYGRSGKTANLVSVLFSVGEFDVCNASRELFLLKRASTVQWDYVCDLSNLHRNI